MYRLKLLYLNIEKLKYVQKFIFYYDYPKFSKFCYVIFLLLSFFADPSLFASYALLFIILCVVAYSDPFISFVKPWIDKFFFQPKMMNPNIHPDNRVKGKDWIDE